MTLLDVVKDWARERGIGSVSRWLRREEHWEVRLHMRDLGDSVVEVNEEMTRVVIRGWLDEEDVAGCLLRAKTERGLRCALNSLLKARGQRLCQSPRHTEVGCPACGLARRGAGRKVKEVRLPKLPRSRPVQVLPPDEVLTLAPPRPQTVEEAEAELERLMREDAPPEALRAAGARLDAALERRPIN